MFGREVSLVSRIGKSPIKIPDGVDVKINGNCVAVSGPKGNLEQSFNKNMEIVMQEGNILIKRPDDSKKNKSLHGLTRSLVFNMVEGVKNGFEKRLEVNGIGYRAQKQGKNLVMNLGFSHQVIMEEIDGISINVEGQNLIVVSGPDKQKVGQFAAKIREKRPPEPYKGKGIKYVGEHIVRKAGKAGKGAKS